MKKRQWIILGWIFGILIISSSLMFLLIKLKREIPTRPPRMTERWVQASKVAYASILSPVTAKGRVTSAAQVEIVAEASGRIETGDIPIKKGERFQKGALLLTIYKDEAELNLKASKSRFLNSVASLLPDIKVDFPDVYPVYQHFFNQIRLDQPLPELPDIDGEQLRIFLASRSFLTDYYSVLQEELKLSRHSIYAPFDGVYSDVYLEAGAYINTGGRIGQILSTTDLEVEAPVENVNSPWIHIGDAVDLNHPDKALTLKGRVARISQFVDETTQSRSVFIKVKMSGNPALVPGEYLTVSFLPAPVPNVMEIPRQALFNFDQVYTVREGLLKIETVDVVKVTDISVLFRGLDAGVYVVTQALINVAENTPVKILGVDKEDRSSKSQKTNDK